MMLYFFPCIIFYNSEYIQPDDLNELIGRLRESFLLNLYADIPIFGVDVANESTNIGDSLSRYGISRANITDAPTFVIEHGLTKLKFQNMEEYLQALDGIMRPTRS